MHKTVGDSGYIRIPMDGAISFSCDMNYRVIAQGWAFCFRLLRDGRRQITEFLLPGDVVGVDTLSPVDPPYGVRALTDVVLAKNEAFYPGTGGLTRRETQIAYVLEHLVSLGRRDAYERMLVLLLQLWLRLEAAGQTAGTRFHLPLKQEHFADYLGLSVVHVSRTLNRIRRDGLVDVQRGYASILKLEEAMAIAELPSAWLLNGAKRESLSAGADVAESDTA